MKRHATNNQKYKERKSGRKVNKYKGINILNLMKNDSTKRGKNRIINYLIRLNSMNQFMNACVNEAFNRCFLRCGYIEVGGCLLCCLSVRLFPRSFVLLFVDSFFCSVFGVRSR